MLSGYNHDYFSDKIGYFCGLQIELEANDLTCREKLIHIGEVVKKVILAIGLGTTMGRLKFLWSNTLVFYPCKCQHDNTHTSSSASVFCADPSFAVAAPVLKAGHSKKVVAGRRLKLSCKVESLLRNRKWDLDVAGDQQGVPLAGDLLVQGRGSPVITRPAGHHHLQEVCVSYVSFKPESIISL